MQKTKQNPLQNNLSHMQKMEQPINRKSFYNAKKLFLKNSHPTKKNFIFFQKKKENLC